MGLNINLSEGMEVWKMVGPTIAAEEQIEVVLLYAALSANFFTSEL